MRRNLTLNNIVLNGRITANPEIKRTNNTQAAYCQFSLAVRNDWADKDGSYGTQFFDCSAFGGTAEFIGRNIHKGDMLLVRGSLAVQSYQDKDNKTRKFTYIQVEKIENLSPRQAEEKQQPQQQTQTPPQNQNTGKGMMGNQMLDNESSDDALPWL